MESAVILAAGEGRRLRPLTEHLPKCLLEIGGKTVLEHQIDALLSLRIDRITVVAGFQSDKVRKTAGNHHIRCIENTRFRETSSLYSLWLARDAAENGCIVLNGDVLFHPGIMKSLLASPHPDALAVDFDSPLASEEMKVRVDGLRVVALGKRLRKADGENVGMVKLSPDGADIVLQKTELLLRQGRYRLMVPHSVAAVARVYPFAAVPVAGRPWIEMDFPEDYERAQSVVYPAIEAGDGSCAGKNTRSDDRRAKFRNAGRAGAIRSPEGPGETDKPDSDREAI